MSETRLLYTLTTLAQTCAALAAFVGAVGLLSLTQAAESPARATVRYSRAWRSGRSAPVTRCSLAKLIGDIASVADHVWSETRKT